MTRDEIRDNLISEIRVAFKDVKRGDGRSLQELRTLDDYGGEEECLEARKLAKDKSWEEALFLYLSKDSRNWELAFLDAKGVHYYLPALLIWALKATNLRDRGDFFSAIMSLACSTQIKLFQHLTDQQRATVCKFLRYMLANKKEYGLDFDEKMIRRALKRYWAPFCRRNLESE